MREFARTPGTWRRPRTALAATVDRKSAARRRRRRSRAVARRLGCSLTRRAPSDAPAKTVAGGDRLDCRHLLDWRLAADRCPAGHPSSLPVRARRCPGAQGRPRRLHRPQFPPPSTRTRHCRDRVVDGAARRRGPDAPVVRQPDADSHWLQPRPRADRLDASNYRQFSERTIGGVCIQGLSIGFVSSRVSRR